MNVAVRKQVNKVSSKECIGCCKYGLTIFLFFSAPAIFFFLLAGTMNSLSTQLRCKHAPNLHELN